MSSKITINSAIRAAFKASLFFYNCGSAEQQNAAEHCYGVIENYSLKLSDNDWAFSEKSFQQKCSSADKRLLEDLFRAFVQREEEIHSWMSQADVICPIRED